MPQPAIVVVMYMCVCVYEPLGDTHVGHVCLRGPPAAIVLVYICISKRACPLHEDSMGARYPSNHLTLNELAFECLFNALGWLLYLLQICELGHAVLHGSYEAIRMRQTSVSQCWHPDSQTQCHAHCHTMCFIYSLNSRNLKFKQDYLM
jgi:hypothetical protein